MNAKIRKKIEELLPGMQCPKNYKCAKYGFERLCESVDIGDEHFIQCREKNPSTCMFSQSFGNNYFCQCPLRLHLHKKLKHNSNTPIKTK